MEKNTLIIIWAIVLTGQLALISVGIYQIIKHWPESNIFKQD